jgi:hypothetical protein
MGANVQSISADFRREGRIKVRAIKLIGLTALAALTAMAFVGASSAMAEGSTALCKVDQTPCETKNIISHIHEETLASNPGKLLSEPTVECNVLFLGDASPTLGNPLVITGKFTYSGCNNSCKVEEAGGPSVLKVLRLGKELADVTGKGEVKLSCLFGFIKCQYNGEGLLGHALGPLTATEPNGEVRVEEQSTKKVSGTCPATAKLDLLTTPLEPTYISS